MATRSPLPMLPDPRAQSASRRAAARLSHPTLPVAGFATGVAMLALAVAVGPASHSWTALRLPGVNALVLAVAFAASEAFPVHFEMRREAISFSLSNAPLLVGLFALGPWGLLAARLGGTAVILVVRRRQAPLKLYVNLACISLETTVAVAVFRAIAPPAGGPILVTWPAAFAATTCASLVFSASIGAAISLYQRRWESSLARSLVGLPAVAIVETSLGIVAVTLLVSQPAALLPLSIVVGLVLTSYRTHKSFREKHKDLEQLYDFSGVLGRALREERVGAAVLTHATELLHAESAWLILTAADGSLLTVTVGDDGRSVATSAEPGADRLNAAAHAAGGPTLLSGPLAGEGGIHDLLAAPLMGSSQPLGTLVVADRSGEVRRFSSADLRRLAALAGHAAVAIEAADLVWRLRLKATESEHQSLHDGLTGLPNRALFGRRLDEALRDGTDCAVLLVDLDRFKEVNDALGHHNGDLLLSLVGPRLQGALRREDMIARLGGDEFAVLLPGIAGERAAQHVARLMIELLEEPFVIGDMSVDVGASIGIALAPVHGDDAGKLVQRADVAMYQAKADHTGVEIYAPERDQCSAERLTLVSELRRAIHDRDLDVYYQPQIDLAGGGVFGFEALVRWPHPTKGMILPDDFILMAEHTGLISPLTHLVLDKALLACRSWRDAGWVLRVSVNLSARNLLQPGLVEDVAELLRVHGVPAAALCLEVTETSVMSDTRRTVAVLEALAKLGITIALDDFGTGHSSLAYLKNFPVGEIKIDKSFVLSMLTDRSDEAIVRSIVDLARNLELPVVAEGVEDRETLERLRDLGCGKAQGYLFGRPLPVAALPSWLAERAPAPPDVVPA